MPRYEFRCRTCTSTFEVDRPMSAASDPADCPAGHDDTVKLLTTVGLGGMARTATRTGPRPTGTVQNGRDQDSGDPHSRQPLQNGVRAAVVNLSRCWSRFR